ncbi:MAG: outer membrane protein assembly factor BamE [Anaerolineaceae bacterium]|nr:outer membrane protein assembly factor BamE [Anaerolineaceae bacterium]
MKILFGSLFITIMISLAFLGACTLTAGKKLSDEQVGQIQKGVTTKAAINRMFGNPFSTTVDTNGNEVWVFTYAEEKYIPGSKGRGRYDVHSQRLIITFIGDKVDYYRFTKQ